METLVLKMLNNRSACRAISPRKVEREKLMSLLQAAQLSASCYNYQPWRYLVLDEEQALEKGRKALAEANYWARSAPVLIIGFSKKDLDCHPSDGREFFLFDLGMATQNILLQATELDLLARPMAGFSPNVIREEFSVPPDYTILVMIAIGYKGDLATLDERHQKVSMAQRTRSPLEKNFFFNAFSEEPT
jgi:nitroreductase